MSVKHLEMLAYQIADGMAFLTAEKVLIEIPACLLLKVTQIEDFSPGISC